MLTSLDRRIVSSTFVQTVSTFWPQILLLETEGGENLLVCRENSVQSFEWARGFELATPSPNPGNNTRRLRCQVIVWEGQNNRPPVNSRKCGAGRPRAAHTTAGLLLNTPRCTSKKVLILHNICRVTLAGQTLPFTAAPRTTNPPPPEKGARCSVSHASTANVHRLQASPRRDTWVLLTWSQRWSAGRGDPCSQLSHLDACTVQC